MKEMTNAIINDSIEQMSKLYIMFCLPRMVFDKQTHEFSLEYNWTNDEAKLIFEQYQQRCQKELVDMQKRAAQLCVETESGGGTDSPATE